MQRIVAEGTVPAYFSIIWPKVYQLDMSLWKVASLLVQLA